MPHKRMKFEETTSFKAPAQGVGKVAESFQGELPLVVFTEIHAITANWITRNYTYYPTESLLGNPNEGSGIRSFTYPYPVPVLRDHISSPSPFGDAFACEPYGRVYSTSFVTEQNGGGWVRAVAAITDPYAIARVLSGRFLTVSIGGEVDEVYCSVCTANGNRQNMVETGLCDHVKGQTYDGMLAYWMLGPLYAREISFVNQPSDVNARVVTPSIDAYEARTLLAGTDGEFLVDMATGSHEAAEDYRAKGLGISKQVYRSIIHRAKQARDKHESLMPRHTFHKLLDNPDYLMTLKSTLKGH